MGWKDIDSTSHTLGSATGGSVTGGMSEHTGSGGSGHDNLKPVEYVDPQVAEKEQKAVGYAKLLVILVLGLSLCAIAGTTYHLIKQGEYNNFKAQFENYASEVIAVSSENVKNTFGTIEAFSVSLTSQAKTANMTWPYVLFPDYVAMAGRIRDLTLNARAVILANYVTDSNRLEYEAFCREHLEENIQYGLDAIGSNWTIEELYYESHPLYKNPTPDVISIYDKPNLKHNPHPGPGPYFVQWQKNPVTPNFIMTDMQIQPFIANAIAVSNVTKTATMNFAFVPDAILSQVIQPIFRDVHNTKEARRNADMVGLLRVLIVWQNYFVNLLPEGTKGMVVVIRDKCGSEISFKVQGLEAEPLGEGDWHNTEYDHLEVSADFFSFDSDETIELPEGSCLPELSIHVYPTDELRESFQTNDAWIYTGVVVGIFLFTSFVFVVYDYAVKARQTKVMGRVIQQDKIVSNLFPGSIRDRLYAGANNTSYRDLEFASDDDLDFHSTPIIADLFLETTVLLADISGFTAWSSTRDPSQVFELLESIYGAFDKIAHQRGVFKVETVGDCYVAVAGLPEPREDHAVAMSLFARDCLLKFNQLTNKLEVSLGPDTGDLEIRIGLHSGQVTAGVLRGERSRFQLFGDTVNTAARMETTSMRGRIQVSNSTAELLRAAGKSRWIKPRADPVEVKGKGQLQTFWLRTKVSEGARVGVEMAPILDDGSDSYTANDDVGGQDQIMSKMERLVEWNVDVLSQILKQILAARNSKPAKTERLERQIGSDTSALDEFIEIIPLPKVTLEDLQQRRDPKTIELGEDVMTQLREYISIVAAGYQDNAFHSFEHASHVTASVQKLLARIVSFGNTQPGMRAEMEVELKDLTGHSYGITSDPLTQFSVVFSAVIHDMDHPGVPNAQLVKEKQPEATKYKDKSVAEQKSVDLAWSVLMRPRFKDLRACIYSNPDELKRFRQLVVNTVMATDICDKELQALRKARWAKAFSEDGEPSTPELDMDRKATIVIEHLIQASDVSHTMQHWQVYKQWNERFFMECYAAYKNGRADSDPSIGWYKGEIGFFDFYIIPLAKKLDNCGVFGVSSHEYLNYAQANREEWARTGERVVEEYIEKYEASLGLPVLHEGGNEK